jgi:hypothetical protein
MVVVSGTPVYGLCILFSFGDAVLAVSILRLFTQFERSLLSAQPVLRCTGLNELFGWLLGLAEELEAFWLSLAANYQAGNARERPLVLGVRACDPSSCGLACPRARPAQWRGSGDGRAWRWSEWRDAVAGHRAVV